MTYFQVVLILSHNGISWSCPYSITSFDHKKLSPTCHIMLSHQAVPILLQLHISSCCPHAIICSHIIQHHQAVLILSHCIISSGCRYPITLCHHNKLSSSYQAMTSLHPQYITSFCTIEPSPCPITYHNITPYHQAVPILSHYPMSSNCPHLITSSHLIKLSPYYHIITYHQAVLLLSHHPISLCYPHPIKSFNNKRCPSNYHTVTSLSCPHSIAQYDTLSSSPYHITLVSYRIISSSWTDPITLCCLIKLYSSYHSITLSRMIKLSPSHQIIQSHLAVPVLSQYVLSLSCPHPITLYYLINMSLSNHTMPSSSWPCHITLCCLIKLYSSYQIILSHQAPTVLSQCVIPLCCPYPITLCPHQGGPMLSQSSH